MATPLASCMFIRVFLPQGFLFGPLLSSIYTNDIPSVQSVVTKASINIHVYADDTALSASHSNAIAAAKIVSDDLAKIHD